MGQVSYDFKGKVAIVTGGSRGIGRACALRLAEAGAAILINYFGNEEAAKKTQADVNALGVRTALFKGDVAEEAQIKAMLETCERELGRLDFLISNAVGFTPEMMERVRQYQAQSKRASDIPADFFVRAFEIQAKALFLCAREGSKLMAKHDEGGRIISLSSIGSHRIGPNYLAPGVAKASLEAATRYLAVDLAKQKIVVNCVSGGAIDTDALNYLTRDKERYLQATAARTPMGRSGTPEDLARVVAFLCTDEAAWICGQTIIADGGFSLVN